MPIDEKKLQNIKTFVNYRNGNVHWEPALQIRVVLYALLTILDVQFVYVLPGINILNRVEVIIAIIVTIFFIAIEIFVKYRGDISNDNTWDLLPNSILFVFTGLILLHISVKVIYEVFGVFTFCVVAILMFILCFLISNYARIILMKKGGYIERHPARFFPVGISSIATGMYATHIANSLERDFGKSGLMVVLAMMFMLFALFCIAIPSGFLKFYYTKKYNIEVIPVWLNKSPKIYKSKKLRKFIYKTDQGDDLYFTVAMKEQSKVISYWADIAVYAGDGRHNTPVISNIRVDSPEKKSIHVDTIFVAQNIVCYALNGEPFGKFSDGKWVNFRHIQLEGEPNPEIVMIGETLLQENLRWF
ncbi:MAG: hypothetical protein LBU41_03960, partial [Clostridiales Family XIII bacterium]|nr:hypothetical protein [Clostridiales Family XIII bacterium]